MLPSVGKPTIRNVMTRITTHEDVPARIGPVEFGRLGGWVTARCPHEYAPLMRKAGGMWEPGARLWCIEPRRIGPALRELRRATDPLFRQAGIDLDKG